MRQPGYRLRTFLRGRNYLIQSFHYGYLHVGKQVSALFSKVRSIYMLTRSVVCCSQRASEIKCGWPGRGRSVATNAATYLISSHLPSSTSSTTPSHLAFYSIPIMLHRPSLILSISFMDLALCTFVYRNGGLPHSR